VTGITLRFHLCFLRIRLVFKGLRAPLGRWRPARASGGQGDCGIYSTGGKKLHGL
jgi:hypothetical protein